MPGMQLPTPQALGDLALRTHEILENAMRFQISGQADFGSGTTLATTAAGIDATRAQLKMLHPLLVSRYPTCPPSTAGWTGCRASSMRRRPAAAGHRPASSRTTQREMIDAAAGQTLELLSPIPVIFEADRLIHERTSAAHGRARRAGPRDPRGGSFLRGVLGAGAAAGVAGSVAAGYATGASSRAARPAAAGADDPQARLPAVPFHGVAPGGHPAQAAAADRRACPSTSPPKAVAS